MDHTWLEEWEHYGDPMIQPADRPALFKKTGITEEYDLGLAWNWEYDADFVTLLETALKSRGLKLLQVTPDTLEKTLDALQQGDKSFRVLLDRASDSDERFLALSGWADGRQVCCLNPCEWTRRAWDKAAMHRLIGATLNTPPTIVLPPFAQQPLLPLLDLAPLGGRFTIKPAHGGGGDGVVVGATSVEQVLVARQEYPHDGYLLQGYVHPVEIAGRPAWFRSIYCAGKVFPCWWNMQTHIYTPVTAEETERYGLSILHTITSAIAHYSGLNLFSSEIALAEDGCFVVVDYVNDPLDLRLQSRTPEGVPNEVIWAIATHLADVAEYWSRVSEPHCCGVSGK